MQNKINDQNNYSLVLDETINNKTNSKSNVKTSGKTTVNSKNQIIVDMQFMQNLRIIIHYENQQTVWEC